MKRILALLLLLTAGQLFAQTNPITVINISLPANPDANIANWGTGTSVLVITAAARQASGRIDPRAGESRILIIIKKDGTKICGDYTGATAPGAEINAVTKVWSGTNAASLLGKGCVLPPGDYELSVQFFGNGAAGPATLSDEKIRPFTIRGNDRQSYTVPQGIAPARGAVLTDADIRKPVIFRWTPLVPPLQTGNIIYRLKVFEVLKGQVPTQAVAANSPVLSTDVNTTQFMWQPPAEYASASEPKTFAWTVQAAGKDGKQAYGSNNGTSGVMEFAIHTNPQATSSGRLF